MTKPRELRLLATMRCKPYGCEAKAYIQDEHTSGYRHLVVQYGDGYSGRADIVEHDGTREFAAAIPHDMTEQQVVNEFLLWPMKSPDAPYPTWEVPARVHGSPTLFRWWAGEQPV